VVLVTVPVLEDSTKRGTPVTPNQDLGFHQVSGFQNDKPGFAIKTCTYLQSLRMLAPCGLMKRRVTHLPPSTSSVQGDYQPTPLLQSQAVTGSNLKTAYLLHDKLDMRTPTSTKRTMI